MDVTAELAVPYGQKTVADEHAAQADAKEHSIEVKPLRSERRSMERIGRKRLGEHGDTILEAIGRVFFDFQRHQGNAQSIALRIQIGSSPSIRRRLNWTSKLSSSQ